MAETGSSGRGRLFRSALLLFLAVGLFGCDHATKFAAKASLEGSAAVPIAPDVLRGAVELRYTQNDDIAFSAFHLLGVPRSPILLVSLASVAIAFLSITVLLAMRRARASTGPEAEPVQVASQVGFALVLGGAFGNLVDRIVRGYVVDFIHVRGWPVFNVADIAVVAGALMIALAHVRRRRDPAPS